MIYNRYVAYLFLAAFLVLVLGLVLWTAPSFVMRAASSLLFWVPHDEFSPAAVRNLGAQIIGGGAIGAYVAFVALIAQFQINRYYQDIEAKRQDKTARAQAYANIYSKLMAVVVFGPDAENYQTEMLEKKTKELLDLVPQVRSFAPPTVRMALGEMEQVLNDIKAQGFPLKTSPRDLSWELDLSWQHAFPTMVEDIGADDFYKVLERTMKDPLRSGAEPEAW